MNCYEFQDYISSYIEKELSLLHIKRFDRHLETCPSCENAYEGVLSVFQSLRESERVAVSSGFNARLSSRLEKSVNRPTRRYSRYYQGGRILGFEPRYALASVAALVLIIVLSVGLLPEKEGVPSGNPIPLSTRRDVTTSSDRTELKTPASFQGEFAGDSKDDSTDAPQDVPGPTQNFDDRIRLVKDRQ
ncbi:MAG: zf-HC2 domain-containing protein [Candidatus Neomarinimicrobiota bacterium]